MNPELLDYYNRELFYIRELALEFSVAHPKIGRRLGMRAGEIGDPYVNSLLQSSALVTARTQMRLDAAFPELTSPLLQMIYPNYTCPTPSMAVARLFPRAQSKHAHGGTLVPRGTSFISDIPDGETTACEFRSSQDVTLFPLEVIQASLTGAPPDIPALDRYLRPGTTARSAVRLRLRTTNGASMSSLALGELPVYLAGDEAVASHLFELIHVSAVASIVGVPNKFATTELHAVTENAITHGALEPEQSVLPMAPGHLHGHSLLQEYFACPSRFWFFTLTNLEQGFASIAGSEAEIVVLLERPAGELAGRVDASQFALFCTPVINLFPKRSGRLYLDPAKRAHRLEAVPAAPHDYEVHSVQSVWGQVSDESEVLHFDPLHAHTVESGGHRARYYTVKRELKRTNSATRHRNSRRPFTETDTFISLVDQDEQPLDEKIRYLSFETLLTNRDLPCLLSCNGRADLSVQRSAPVDSIGLLRAPTTPQPPLASGDRAWRLLGQLSIDRAAFDSDSHCSTSGEGLRKLLRLNLADDIGVPHRHVEGLLDASSKAVNRRLPTSFSQPFGRGVECTLNFDESMFDGVSPYTFGLVLERYLARHVSAHSFTTAVLESKQRGRIAQWPPRAGTRSAV
ncbi:type VI secretion system protein ImpG [Paraburkholderia sp. GAS199]|uniref:type VI secretion system baseplate subunit TssF n=1 Tax=Paraburkholderia sp. GAS199 TaxID=3035126 RepID=UPI003D1AC2F2